jgi:hypothetical protein
VSRCCSDASYVSVVLADELNRQHFLTFSRTVRGWTCLVPVFLPAGIRPVLLKYRMNFDRRSDMAPDLTVKFYNL